VIVTPLAGRWHMDPSHAPTDPSQAPARVIVDTSSPLSSTGAAAVVRACAVCGCSVVGRRPETVTCSARCRSALARQRRRDDLIARVRRAETSLKEAAAALASLKELAGLDATLELRSIIGSRL
jgi:predicted nucleic acid-binding Zn ribbon protein